MEAKGPVTDMAYSKDGAYLAVTDEKKVVTVFTVADNYSVRSLSHIPLTQTLPKQASLTCPSVFAVLNARIINVFIINIFLKPNEQQMPFVFRNVVWSRLFFYFPWWILHPFLFVSLQQVKNDFYGHHAKVVTLAWSPDNEHFASGGMDMMVYVWTVNDADKRLKIPGECQNSIQ